MIYKAEKLESVTIKNPRGGEGEMSCKYAFRPENAPVGSAFQLLASITLPPGSSIGLHEHSGDEEIYIIISGTGTFCEFFENGERKGKQVQTGDMLVTLKGESHALSNTGLEPLVFVAVVVK